jgi:hypothetical protein
MKCENFPTLFVQLWVGPMRLGHSPLRQIGLKMFIFHMQPTSPRIWNALLVQDGQKVQIEAIVTFIIFLDLMLLDRRSSCSLIGHIGAPPPLNSHRILST